MVLKARGWLLAGVLCLARVSLGQDGGAVRFRDYPAAVKRVDRPAALRLTDVFSRRYRTQLREAVARAGQAPDFAEQAIPATSGCGASCVMGAAVDLKTGAVVKLPFTVSDWPLEVTEPLVYRADSSLLLVRGRRSEGERGTYYYRFYGAGV